MILNVLLHDGGVSGGGGDSDNPIQWIWYKINPDVSPVFVAVFQT